MLNHQYQSTTMASFSRKTKNQRNKATHVQHASKPRSLNNSRAKRDIVGYAEGSCGSSVNEVPLQKKQVTQPEHQLISIRPQQQHHWFMQPQQQFYQNSYHCQHQQPPLYYINGYQQQNPYFAPQQYYHQQQEHHASPWLSQSQEQQNQHMCSDAESFALDQLQLILECLTHNPFEFEAIAINFLNIFKTFESNQYVLSIAMEDIFRESLNNPMFRCIGAKLYCLLHSLNPKHDSVFHMLLKCKLDFHQQEVKQYMESNQQCKVHETAFFLAEMSMQLPGDCSPMVCQLIAENIAFSLKQLLVPRGDYSVEDVRCICLTLNLSGPIMTVHCYTEIREIVEQLDAINTAAPVKFPMVAELIQYLRHYWERKF